MRFWQGLIWVETEQLLELAKFAEDVGFDGIFNADHAVYPKDVKSPYQGSDDDQAPMSPDWPYPDCWATIAAMAAVTKRVRFSTAVYILPLRSPLEVAKAAGTLAILSNNRFDLGIGVGWMKEEFDIFGIDFHTRGKRTDEMFTVMRKLWNGGMVAHKGRFFNFPEIQISPAPSKPVPILVGGDSPAALHRAATLGDGWIGNGSTPDQARTQLAELARLRREAGRGHLPFDAVVPLTTPPDIDTFKRLEELGMTSGMNYPFMFELGLTSTVDQKKRFMERFARDVISKMK